MIQNIVVSLAFVAPWCILGIRAAPCGHTLLSASFASWRLVVGASGARLVSFGHFVTLFAIGIVVYLGKVQGRYL